MTWRAMSDSPYNSVAYGNKQGMDHWPNTAAHATHMTAAAMEDIKAGLAPRNPIAAFTTLLE